MRIVWLLVSIHPWLVEASPESKIYQTRKCTSKDNFIKGLLDVPGNPGEESVLMKRIGFALARMLATKSGKHGVSFAIIEIWKCDIVIWRNSWQGEWKDRLIRRTSERRCAKPPLLASFSGWQPWSWRVPSAFCIPKDLISVLRLVLGSNNCRDVVACTKDGLRVSFFYPFQSLIGAFFWEIQHISFRLSGVQLVWHSLFRSRPATGKMLSPIVILSREWKLRQASIFWEWC